MKEDIVVSIICNTYNHEKYIKDALEGFIMQKTNFLFEVLIHDDASTDATSDIIREYEKKYPNIIKPIYQTENQYSRSVNIGSTFQFPRAIGKYIAFCEGDDYWTDAFKLQKQFDAMENHPEIDICAHASDVVESETKKLIRKIEHSDHDTIFCVEDVICGGGGFISTNSLFCRKELNDSIPEFRKYLMLDYTLQIHGALRNGMLYLKDNMSAYRMNSVGSWTNSIMSDKQKQYLHLQKIIKMGEILDKETNFGYSEAIANITRYYKIELLYIERLNKKKLNFEDWKLFFSLSPKWKLIILLAPHQRIFKFSQKIKNFFRK